MANKKFELNCGVLNATREYGNLYSQAAVDEMAEKKGAAYGTYKGGCFYSLTWIPKIQEQPFEENGWVIRQYADNTVKCVAKRIYSDGEHICVITIKKTYTTTVVYVNGKEISCHSRKGGWEDASQLILSGGYIDSRYGKVRSQKYTDFLTKNKLTEVAYVTDVNEDYSGRREQSARGNAWIEVFTDGNVEEDFEPITDWLSSYDFKVTGANWVVVDSGHNYGGDGTSSACILYVPKGTNIFKLDLSSLRKSQR